MVISSRQTIATLDGNISLSLNGLTLQQVETTKYLGLTIDQFLTWRNNFIHQLSWTQACPEEMSTNRTLVPKGQTEVGCGILILKRIRPFVALEHHINVYRPIGGPCFTYCCIVWDSIGETGQQTVFKSCKIGPIMLLQVLLVQNIQLIFGMNLAGFHFVK